MVPPSLYVPRGIGRNKIKRIKTNEETSFRSASGYSSSAAKGGGIIDFLRSLIDKKIMPSSEMNMPNGAHGGARGLRNPALPDSEKKRIVFLKNAISVRDKRKKI